MIIPFLLQRKTCKDPEKPLFLRELYLWPIRGAGTGDSFHQSAQFSQWMCCCYRNSRYCTKTQHLVNQTDEWNDMQKTNKPNIFRSYLLVFACNFHIMLFFYPFLPCTVIPPWGRRLRGSHRTDLARVNNAFERQVSSGKRWGRC